ncbi:type II toxin-antitoxin system VapC family toxin [Maricaulis sp.]|uniref:type II toxin-antitoxin system VapC family toxin n=1 Tax=Maricaulis sp. TaxID=1486257 RepID=UPI0025B8AF38|nr:type II toxin-antitoxin system VapC family toxin [Maricaulis sp.]
MKACVLDASVAVKVFVEDRYSDQAASVMRRYTPAAPGIILSETANAFWLYLRQGVVQITDMRLAIRKLAALVTVCPDEELVEDALAMAAELDHPVYDCLYMALARREGLPIISADKRMIKLASEQLKIETIPLSTIPIEDDAP